MSDVDWDSGHAYCSCEHCSPEDESDGDSMNCNQSLYCAPELINHLTGEFSICSCECANRDRFDTQEEYVDYIEGFIELADEAGSSDWYHTRLLKNWVKKQRLIILKESLTINVTIGED